MQCCKWSASASPLPLFSFSHKTDPDYAWIERREHWHTLLLYKARTEPSFVQHFSLHHLLALTTSSSSLTPCASASSNSHCSWLRPVLTLLVRISPHHQILKAHIPQQLTSSLLLPPGITAPGGQKALWDGSAKADQCFWSGTSPFCAGSCDSGYSDCGTSGCGDGACCWTGYKKYCCRGSCPAVLPFLEANPGKPLVNFSLFPFQLDHSAF